MKASERRVVLHALIGLTCGCAAADDGSVSAHEAAVDEEVRDAAEVPEQVVEPARLIQEVEGPGDSADLDGDGWPSELDIDDQNPFSFPGAPEIPCNGIDEDGDATDLCLPDVDGDGVDSSHDCDDLDPNVNPLAPDYPCDGVDSNCNGRDPCDTDDDGSDDSVDPAPRDPAITLEAREAAVERDRNGP